MRITQGTFSFLPDLTDEQIVAQLNYCIDNEWSVAVEHTDDPHPRNIYWELWGLPMFDLADPAAMMLEVTRCRELHPQSYVRVTGYDRSYGRQTTAISFIVNRPLHEPGFRLQREEGSDRRIRYTLHSYAVDNEPGARYRPSDT
ncbi:MAG: ribulose bisphosphate carboxylase small subunit [bacterium]